MCDDDFFDDDMDGLDDSLFDPDTDIQEDLADEDGEDLIDALDAGNSSVIPDIETDHFDMSDAIVLGIIVGSAYDAAIDEKNQSKLIKSENKYKK